MGEKSNLAGIRAIFMDVDGILTDGKIILGNSIELKSFHVRDGMAIAIARRCNIKIGFITNRSSDAVKRRADELKIDFLSQGTHNKLSCLKEISSTEKISMNEICYIGDDIIDIPVLKNVGFSATVADAPDEIKRCVHYISKKNGGCEAVRDIIQHVLSAQGKWDRTINDMISEIENTI